MTYAIIEANGKQYKVEAGSIIDLDHVGDIGLKNIAIDKVLLYVLDNEVNLGTPYLSSVVVKGTLLENVKGKKVTALRFLAKSRHRRKVGFRRMISRVRIDDIVSKNTKVVQNTDIKEDTAKKVKKEVSARAKK